MNGSRSTFMRKGYLLTALAAAVLLAASPGIASAQSVSFSTSSGSLPEGATGAPATPAPLHIYVDISGIEDDPATMDVDESTTSATAAGNITIVHNLDAGGLSNTTDPTDANAVRVWQRTGGNLVGITNGNVNLAYRGNGRLELVVIDPANGQDGNWLDEKYTLKLASSDNGVSAGGVFNLSIVDDEVAPVAKFKHINAPNVSLQEASSTTINVGIDAGTTTGAKQGVMSVAPTLMAMITPANAKIGDCGGTAGNFLDIQDTNGNVTVSMEGTFPLGSGTLAPSMQTTAGATATYGVLSVEACSDMAGFRDMQVGLSFVATSLASGTDGVDGRVADGGTLTITVDSNEATPTVSFATSSIDIDEGSTNTVAILADGELGPEVGTVMVSKSGYAMLSLWQGNDMLEANADGMYAVDLMDSANTILTISADSDRDLEDGMTSTGTLTIESASGANIGDRDSLMVTVEGSTAVPALPLVGQLLLALFLMAGGARLYRRRQG